VVFSASMVVGHLSGVTHVNVMFSAYVKTGLVEHLVTQMFIWLSAKELNYPHPDTIRHILVLFSAYSGLGQLATQYQVVFSP
jgi:hypothetical protein